MTFPEEYLEPDESGLHPRVPCEFTVGTVECVNGSKCRNNRHQNRIYAAEPYKDVWNMPRRGTGLEVNDYNQYLIPQPDGKRIAHSRVTTVAKVLEDKYNLEQWALRMCAYGIGQREDLFALAASADGPDDYKTLKTVVAKASEAAAKDRKANIGTALHGFTEKIDRGDKRVNVPKQWQAHVERYQQALVDHGIAIIPSMTERIVILPEHKVAGTMDRGVYYGGGLPKILDLKSGDLRYAALSIAIQLGCYARAEKWWDPETEAIADKPQMDVHTGLVLRLPEGGGDAEVHEIDLIEGWKYFELAMQVRQARKDGKKLLRGISLDANPPANDIPAQQDITEASLRDRVRKIAENPEAYKALKQMWQDDVPTLKEGGLTMGQLDLVADWCAQVEERFT